MNRLRITLLLSTLMLPALAFSADGNPSDGSAPGTDQKTTVKDTAQGDETSASNKSPKSTGTDKQPENSKVDRGNLDNSNEDPSEDDNAGNKGLLKGALCWSAGLVVSPIDWIATPFVSGIGKLATLKCLKDRCVGTWLTSHNKGLSRAVVVMLIGGSVYYYWKKCQECKKAEDETSRSMSSSYNFFEVQDDEDMTQSV